MKSFTLYVPRNIFKKFHSNPEALTSAVTNVLENANFQAVTKEVLNDYTFNNKPYTKKVSIELVVNPRLMQGVYQRARVIDADISQLVSIAIDLALYKLDPDYKGLGFKFIALEKSKVMDVLLANVFTNVESFSSWKIQLRSEVVAQSISDSNGTNTSKATVTPVTSKPKTKEEESDDDKKKKKTISVGG